MDVAGCCYICLLDCVFILPFSYFLNRRDLDVIRCYLCVLSCLVGIFTNECTTYLPIQVSDTAPSKRRRRLGL